MLPEIRKRLLARITGRRGAGVVGFYARGIVGTYNQNRCDNPLKEDANFEAWFRRAWALRDRPMPALFDGDGL